MIAETKTFEIVEVGKDNPFFDVRTGSIYLGTIRTKKKLRITIEGVGMSEIGNSTVAPEPNTEQLFESYLANPATKATPYEFIRSSVIRIKGLHQEKTVNPLGEIDVYFQFDAPMSIESSMDRHFSVA